MSETLPVLIVGAHLACVWNLYRGGRGVPLLSNLKATLASKHRPFSRCVVESLFLVKTYRLHVGYFACLCFN
eukprot:4978628-Amphidinium_carterae.1